MKISVSKEHGGVLLVTLVLTVIMGSTLAAYLKLVEFQNRAVKRSQHWNAAIPAAEAGIEEALTHLNYLGDGNRAANGWQLVNGNYQLTRHIGTARYEVSIDAEMQPTITAIGYVEEPLSGRELKRTVKVETTRFGAGMRGGKIRRDRGNVRQRIQERKSRCRIARVAKHHRSIRRSIGVNFKISDRLR